jgi:hypothetical protein
MTKLFWILGWIGVAIWSLLALGAYGLVDLFGGLLARNADVVGGQPEAVEWLAWILNGLKGLGLAAIVVVWAVVSLGILAVPWLFSRLARTGATRPGQVRYSRPHDPRVVDLGPGQYRVDPNAPPPGPPRRLDGPR